MRRPTAHPLVGRSLGPWLAALAACASSCGLARPRHPGPTGSARGDRPRGEAPTGRGGERQTPRAARPRPPRVGPAIRELEERYLELKQHVGEPRRDARPTPEDPPGQAGEDAGRSVAPRPARRAGPGPRRPRGPPEGPVRRRVPARLRGRRVRPPVPRPRPDRLQALHPQRPHVRQERPVHPPGAGLPRGPADPASGSTRSRSSAASRGPGTSSTAT